MSKWNEYHEMLLVPKVRRLTTARPHICKYFQALIPNLFLVLGMSGECCNTMVLISNCSKFVPVWLSTFVP